MAIEPSQHDAVQMDLLNVRLRLFEFAVSHSLEQVLQKTLDELEALTQSTIGFYHFVDNDQKTILRHTWSTRTIREFCETDGRGMHSGLEQAGVWADCVHQHRPVIHNDYASLSHRQGLPAGHVPIVRELVVPVIKDDRIAAVIGVGNKPCDYTQADVDMVSFLADVAWMIARQKTVEAALAASEKRYRAIFDLSPAAIAIAGLVDSRFVDINGAWQEITGYTREEVIGRTSHDLDLWVDPGQREQLMNRLRERGRTHLEMISRRKDGDIRDLLISAEMVTINGDGYILGMAQDITTLKQAESALRESRRRLVEAQRIASLGDFTWDLETGVVSWSDGLFHLLGYEKHETIDYAMVTTHLPHPEDQARVTRWFDDAIASGKDVLPPADYRIIRKDGNTRSVRTQGRIRRRAGEKPEIFAIVQDVTEHLQLEARYQQAQKMESVGRLAGGVAHDYNNILSVILGYTEMALEKVQKEDPLYEDLEEIYTAAGRSREITRQLLAFARKETIAPEVLDLNATVESMLKILRRLIGENIDLVWLPGRRLWPVLMDPAQIDQILANLCVNARDAIADVGRIIIETNVAVIDAAYCADHAGLTPGEYVMLSVSDDGCGMDRVTLDRIFEPFFTTKEMGRGTGLGLATVYGMVKQNNGYISALSEPGKGTTFKIYLPSHAGDIAELQRRDAVKVPQGNGETVLVAEDEIPIMSMVDKILTDLNYTVLTARTPSEALRVASDHAGRIDLLITDVIMPEMNGRKLAEEMKGRNPKMRCLFMSGYTEDVIANKGVLGEGLRFIQKPLSYRDLAVKVKAVLAAE